MKIYPLSIGIVVCFCCFYAEASARDFSSETMKKRLQTMEREIPFPYHSALIEQQECFVSESGSLQFSNYRPFIEAALRQNGLPLALKYLPLALSGKDNKYNSFDCQGVWALSVPFALRGGLVVTANHDERFDFSASTLVAVSRLSELYAMYGDWWAVILAYANSPAALNAATLRNSDQNLQVWDYYEKGLLPNVDIIRRFILLNCFYDAQERVDVTEASSNKYLHVEIKKPISLQLLSNILAVDAKEIRVLNPVFRSDPLLPLDGYLICLPKRAADLFLVLEDSLYKETERMLSTQISQIEKKEEHSNSATVYTVRFGDSLGKIAKRFDVSLYSLKNWNHLADDAIFPGQKLLVSACAERQIKSKPSMVKTQPQPSNKIVYTIRSGDTLGAIAVRHKVSVADIRRWNNLNGDLIHTGQRLVIYKR